MLCGVAVARSWCARWGWDRKGGLRVSCSPAGARGAVLTRARGRPGAAGDSGSPLLRPNPSKPNNFKFDVLVRWGGAQRRWGVPPVPPAPRVLLLATARGWHAPPRPSTAHPTTPLRRWASSPSSAPLAGASTGLGATRELAGGGPQDPSPPPLSTHFMPPQRPCRAHTHPPSPPLYPPTPAQVGALLPPLDRQAGGRLERGRSRD